MTLMPFAYRLKAARKMAAMSIADLAIWFERSHGTVSSWLRGHEPMACTRVGVEERLELLEWMLAHSEGKVRDTKPQGKRKKPVVGFPLPVPGPDEMKQYERGPYVRNSLAYAQAFSGRALPK